MTKSQKHFSDNSVNTKSSMNTQTFEARVLQKLVHRTQVCRDEPETEWARQL